MGTKICPICGVATGMPFHTCNRTSARAVATRALAKLDLELAVTRQTLHNECVTPEYSPSELEALRLKLDIDRLVDQNCQGEDSFEKTVPIKARKTKRKPNCEHFWSIANQGQQECLFCRKVRKAK